MISNTLTTLFIIIQRYFVRGITEIRLTVNKNTIATLPGDLKYSKCYTNLTLNDLHKVLKNRIGIIHFVLYVMILDFTR